jgi:hypothetical protein
MAWFHNHYQQIDDRVRDIVNIPPSPPSSPPSNSGNGSLKGFGFAAGIIVAIVVSILRSVSSSDRPRRVDPPQIQMPHLDNRWREERERFRQTRELEEALKEINRVKPDQPRHFGPDRPVDLPDPFGKDPPRD